MSKNGRKSAEARLAALMKSKEPMTRETALEVLAALISAGRAKAPTIGGPPPRIPSVEDGEE